MARAKIEIHLYDNEGREGTQVMIRGVDSANKDVTWEYLVGKKRLGTLHPGAEHMAVRMVEHLQAELAKRQIPTILAPEPPKFIQLPGNSFRRRHH